MTVVRHFCRFAPSLLPLIVFLILGAYQLHLPGLHYDEAKEAGLNAMQLVTGQPMTAFRDATVQVGPWRLPLMVQDYIGSLNVLLATPFLAVGGVNAVALRWLPLLTGALTMLLTARVAWRLGGPVAAGITALLLAVNPSFVFWSRQGIFVTNLTALIFMASLLTGLRWWAARRPRDLWLTAFLWGLGIYAKLLFVWAIGAMVVVALAGWGIGRGARGQGGRGAEEQGNGGMVARTWLIAALCFVIPLVPLILFNLRTGGTLASIFGNLGHSYYGVDNRAYLPNLLTRLGQLRTLLRGDHFWYLGGIFANPWAPWVAGGLVLAALAERVRGRVGEWASGPMRKPVTLSPCHLVTLSLLLALIVAQSAFTVSDLFITHYVLLLPLIPLAGGLAAGALLHRAGEWAKGRVGDLSPSPTPPLRRSRLTIPILAAVLLWAGGDLWTTVRYHRALAATGGHAAHSDATANLAEFLDRGGLTAPLALDWGLDAPVRFLTTGRVNPIEVFGYAGLDAPDAGFTDRVRPFLANPVNVYLAHAPEETVFRGRVEALAALAREQGLTLREEARFAERSGRPLFVVYRLSSSSFAASTHNTGDPAWSPTPAPTFTATGAGGALWPPPIPTTLLLTVRETAGIARSGEVVRSGVPFPRALDVRNPAALTLVDAAGVPVPAEFEALARWDAGRAADAPIQWLLVTFPASVAAHGSAAYRLVTDGSAGPNPTPAVTVGVIQAGDQVTVNTGAAIFCLGGDPGALFDEVRLADGTRLVSGSALTATVDGVNAAHPTTRRVWVEHAGPLAAVVVREGAYDLPPAGGGGLSSRRRYVFTAGSPTALVRQAVNWEGDRCGAGVLTCDGSPNALRVERVRDTLNLAAGSELYAEPWAFSAGSELYAEPVVRESNSRTSRETSRENGFLTVTAVGDFEVPAVQGSAAAGQSAWVRQQLRASRAAPLAFDVSVPGTGGATGEKADGGMLAVSGAAGTVAVALNHMHRYEPQALRLLEDGRLAVDVADDSAWLGARQGLFATLAVNALPAGPTRADLDRQLWAPLNRPLRAWPAPAWFAASDAVDEFPVGSLPAEVASYDTLVSSVLSNTLQQVDAKGLAGLMTFGVYPRYWGTPVYGDELDCGDNDPTPGETWDNAYWCATWTDYHNTVATAPTWAMRSGQVEWLDEIAIPAALRTLHTQIMQCAPGDTWFYCAQAPAGYGGYRADFNSSHAYFDNLFLYYWLTGDYTVVETLARGAYTMRDYLCSRRPAEPCLPDDPPADEWAHLSGRVASQWFAAFRFVGLAGADAGYLEDYRSVLARAVTQHYVEVEQTGTRYGFWLGAGNRVDGPGTDTSDQLWMAALYDMNNLYRLQRDTADAPIGNPAIPPSQAIAAWARTLVDFGSTVAGDGTAGGAWPNALDFTWSGERIGGTLASVVANLSGGDPYLYDTGKATLTALLLRAGQGTGDPALTQMGADLTGLALNAALNDGSPLGKVQGEYLARLHAAVARLAGAAQPACPADVTGDGAVNVLDVQTVAAWWGRPGFPPAADLDGDGDVDLADLQAVAAQWGHPCPTLRRGLTSLSAAPQGLPPRSRTASSLRRAWPAANLTLSR